jgi:hypothetical protein
MGTHLFAEIEVDGQIVEAKSTKGTSGSVVLAYTTGQQRLKPPVNSD